MPAVSDACNMKLYLSIKPWHSWGHCAHHCYFFIFSLYLRQKNKLGHCIGTHHYYRILHHKCCVFNMPCQVKNSSNAKYSCRALVFGLVQLLSILLWTRCNTKGWGMLTITSVLKNKLKKRLFCHCFPKFPNLTVYLNYSLYSSDLQLLNTI